MIQRGIHTTTADIWMHLFPFEKALYWYLVRHMREHIADKKIISRLGRSKDGTPTGDGYLVRKDAPFIARVNVPDAMIDAFLWREGTDRQVGLLWGEQVVDWMMATGQSRIPPYQIERLNTRAAQNNQGDFGITMHMLVSQVVEVKTEMKDSQNLYVQTREGGHRVHQRKDSHGTVEHRFSVAPALSD